MYLLTSNIAGKNWNQVGFEPMSLAFRASSLASRLRSPDNFNLTAKSTGISILPENISVLGRNDITMVSVVLPKLPSFLSQSGNFQVDIPLFLF